jgi:hypothetical protein
MKIFQMSEKTYHFGVQMPDEAKSIAVVLGVLNHNIYNQVTLAVLHRQICSLLIVTALPAHGDCSIRVELEITLRLDELFELLDILEFCVAVEQQRGVVSGSLVMLVKFFQIFNEIVYPLRIEELWQLESVGR